MQDHLQRNPANPAYVFKRSLNKFPERGTISGSDYKVIWRLEAAAFATSLQRIRAHPQSPYDIQAPRFNFSAEPFEIRQADDTIFLVTNLEAQMGTHD